MSLERMARETLNMATEVGSFWLQRFYYWQITKNPKRTFDDLLDRATNYNQWLSCAQMLDCMDGNVAWKFIDHSDHYDYGVCRVGTKMLIESFIGEVCSQLKLIAEMDRPDILTVEENYDFFLNTQRAFGRTALLLSGGAIFGLAHVGVVKTLFKTKLLPKIINGSSVGSIVAAVICSRTDENLLQMLDAENINLDFFERPNDKLGISFKGLLKMISQFFTDGVILEIDVLIEAIRANIGDLTFQEAYFKTKRILNITVSSSTLFEMPKLLNYVTSPTVVIWSAVAASCAIPGCFKSSPLKFKDKSGNILDYTQSGQRWIDGSVENDLPMARLSEMFGVNHFIVSQVNPHVSPALRILSIPYVGSGIKTGANLFWSEIQHWLHQFIELGFPAKILQQASSILTQKYTGEITIVPPISIFKYTEVMANPDKEMFLYYTLIGERATYPLVSAIKTHYQIEQTIEEIVYNLRIKKLQMQKTQYNTDSSGANTITSASPTSNINTSSGSINLNPPIVTQSTLSIHSRSSSPIQIKSPSLSPRGGSNNRRVIKSSFGIDSENPALPFPKLYREGSIDPPRSLNKESNITTTSDITTKEEPKKPQQNEKVIRKSASDSDDHRRRFIARTTLSSNDEGGAEFWKKPTEPTPSRRINSSPSSFEISTSSSSSQAKVKAVISNDGYSSDEDYINEDKFQTLVTTMDMEFGEDPQMREQYDRILNSSNDVLDRGGAVAGNGLVYDEEEGWISKVRLFGGVDF